MKVKTQLLNTEKLKTKPVIRKKYSVLNARAASVWIVDQSATFGYNPFTYTILKCYSTGDTHQVENQENPVDHIL